MRDELLSFLFYLFSLFRSNCLPGKSIGQIYMQTQRLIGQQSLGEFMGLSVDLEKVFLDNMRKTVEKKSYKMKANLFYSIRML